MDTNKNNKSNIILNLITIYFYILSFVLIFFSLVLLIGANSLIKRIKIIPKLSDVYSLMIFSAIIFIAIGTLDIFVAVNLVKKKRWARNTAILLSIVACLIGFLQLFKTMMVIGLFNVISNSIIAGCLLFNKDIKQAFKKNKDNSSDSLSNT